MDAKAVLASYETSRLPNNWVEKPGTTYKHLVTLEVELVGSIVPSPNGLLARVQNMMVPTSEGKRPFQVRVRGSKVEVYPYLTFKAVMEGDKPIGILAEVMEVNMASQTESQLAASDRAKARGLQDPFDGEEEEAEEAAEAAKTTRKK